MASSSTHTALQSFSLTNDIVEISPDDVIYKYDAEENRKINNLAPWRNESVLHVPLIQPAI